MRRFFALLTLGTLACSPSKTATRAGPGLESSPTRGPGIRQLPAALDVDPATRVPSQPLDFELRAPEVVTLSNGLRVYLLEDHQVPLVLVRALVVAGSADDPADKVGLTSLTAALMAEGGAGNRTPDALEQVLDARAADLSSGAGNETALTTLSMRSDDLDSLVPLFADVVQRPAFDDRRFQVAISRSLESVRRREDRPDGVAARALDKALFGPLSKLGREATDASLKSIALGDVKRQHQALWGAKSTRLIVTGDYQKRPMLELLEREFGKWTGGAPAKRTWEAKPDETKATRIIVVPRKIAQAKVRVGAPGYARRSPDEYPLRLLATSLGAFGVGRLYREIRDERGLAYSAGASASPGPTTGTLTASFDTRPEQVKEALTVAVSILAGSSSSTPLTASELQIAKDMSINAFAFRFDSAAKIALERASYDVFDYPVDYLARWRSTLADVSPASVSTTAQARLGALQIVIVGPVEKMGDLSQLGPVTIVNDVERFF